MHALRAVRTNPFLKRKAQALEKKLKKYVTRLIHRLIPHSDGKSASELITMKKVLLVRPNFRIGNALMSTPAVLAFQEKYPDATIDMLATDNTGKLFDNLPIGKLHKLSRKAILKPWKAIKLVHDLRKEKYDLAVQLTAGSLTNFLFVKAINAQYSMGMYHKGECWHDIKVEGKAKHAYDTAALLSSTLGISCRTRPIMRFSTEEEELARNTIKELAEARAGSILHEPFVVLFIGGHLDKRCPLSYWIDLIEKLETTKTPYIVFVGPEEIMHCRRIEMNVTAMRHGAICRPRPLREFAAMLKQARVLVTPDSGPMHMAVAVDVPTITVVMTPKSRKFLPSGRSHMSIWDLNVDQTMALITHSGGSIQPESRSVTSARTA